LDRTREYFGAPAHLRQASPVASEAQARCDAIQAEYRSGHAPRMSIRREPPPLAAALVPTDDQLKLRLAEELEYARRMLEQMGDTLSNDPLVVARHITSLQSVDIIGQLLGHIANVVRSSDPDGAVDRIGMCDLKARLTR
jgi:hypothetical protein